MKTVVADNLGKKFGSKSVLKGVSFEVEESEIFGLIGPNGAGKTTTLRILATILKPDLGDAWIMGYSVRNEPTKVRRNIAYLPEDAGVYRHLTGIEFLRFMAGVYGRSESYVKRGVEISGLGSALESPMGSYSKGMKRRILLAAVLMIEPKVVILDEPTSGLDVIHAVHIRRAIKRFVREHGASAIVSSHNMLEVEYLCDRVAFISDGRIIAEGKPSELKEEYNAENLEEVFSKLIEVS
ncbi:MAG: ABC transporter ATP-binding protein [Thaumarchaeota archaeon]|nr:ABC transporter ATP-binding protein [Nitrososphaerota archaeon]